MTKDTALGILRALLTLAGTYLIGHNLGFLGAVTSETWQIVLGAVLTLVGTVWGIVDKTTGPEQLQSALRSIVVSIGGFLVAAGKLSNTSLDAIIGLVMAIIPLIQKKASSETNKQIADPNQAITADLKTGKVVNPNKPQS